MEMPKVVSGEDGVAAPPRQVLVRVYSSRPFTPVAVDVLDAAAARADFVERSGGATLSFDEDNAPQFTSLLPGEVAAPASPKDWEKLTGFYPSNGQHDSPRFEAIPLGRYTVLPPHWRRTQSASTANSSKSAPRESSGSR